MDFKVAKFLASVVLLQSMSVQAQLVDLPNPNGEEPSSKPPVVDVRPSPKPAPTPPPPPLVRPEPRQYSNNIILSEITRASGGEWYSVAISRPSIFATLQIQADFARVKIHEVILNLENGSSRKLNALTGKMVEQGDIAESVNLRGLGKVTSVDLRLESYGGSADVVFRALTFSGDLRLSLAPVRQEPPPPPQPPQRPEVYEPPANVSGSCGRSGDITQELDAVDRELMLWGQRRGGYYSGTQEYRYSNDQAIAAAQRMTELVRRTNISRSGLNLLQRQGDKWANKGAGHYSGTLEHKTYQSLAISFYNAMLPAAEIAVACERPSTDQLIGLALSASNRRSSFYSGTTQHNVYGSLVQYYFNSAIKLYPIEVQQARKDFRTIENEMERFASKRASYYSGTMEHTSYSKLVNSASSLAQEAFRTAAYGWNAEQRYQYVSYYSGKRSAYYSGTDLYNHFSTMLAIAAGR